MGFIENNFLYDSTSKPAVIAGIASSTGIPFFDVRYEQNPELLCPEDEEDGGGDSNDTGEEGAACLYIYMTSV